MITLIKIKIDNLYWIQKRHSVFCPLSFFKVYFIDYTITVVPFFPLCPVPPSHQHSWCWFLGRWFCVHSRTLWASSVNFPVRMGVSPASATPCFYSQRFWGFLFPHWTLDCVICLTPRFIHMQMWDHLVHQPPLHPSNLQAATLPCTLSAPAAWIHPSYHPEWMFLL